MNIGITSAETPFITSDHPVISLARVRRDVCPSLPFRTHYLFPLSPTAMLILSERSKSRQLRRRGGFYLRLTSKDVESINALQLGYCTEHAVSSADHFTELLGKISPDFLHGIDPATTLSTDKKPVMMTAETIEQNVVRITVRNDYLVFNVETGEIFEDFVAMRDKPK